MHIVLVEPEIPANTGNVARLCAVTGTPLHLVRPLGFSVDDKHLKRAGLDYWDMLDIHYYDSIYEVLEKFPDNSKFFLTSKADKSYTEVKYDENSLLIFGKETKGLPENLRLQFPDDCVRIPMIEGARCLNLSNAVAVVTYEALRQLGKLGSAIFQ
ncbi:MAG: tRNA (cytidine(34)-2'-O)-methyltransferase [Acidaminococcaceae bacterium]|nr:tRNA (cytidine(34)-2'-O)-methyltransferase [Acidaminococcaceae bacterium]